VTIGVEICFASDTGEIRSVRADLARQAAGGTGDQLTGDTAARAQQPAGGR
jgi:hypothetical protein